MENLEIEHYLTLRLNHHEVYVIINALIDAGNKGINKEINEERHTFARILSDLLTQSKKSI